MVSKEKLQAWWAHRQGLLEIQPIDRPDAIFERFGWARSVAGCNPYLGAFARARLNRAALDEAVAELRISELPAARGCTYVLPHSHFAAGLSLGANSGDAEFKLALSLGATEDELKRLSEAVLDAIKTKPLGPAELKSELGSLVRSFGEVGKKKGLTTSLPIALGSLQQEGRIVRRPVNGRLDEQKYLYAVWESNPPKLFQVSQQQSHQIAAELFFGWMGPATIGEFATFAGLSQRAAKEAAANLDLIPVEGMESHMILARDHKEFTRFQAPTAPCYRLLNRLDALLLLHADLSPLIGDHTKDRLADLQHKEVVSMKELGFNPIIDRGAIVGLWEFDPDSQEIVYVSFVDLNDAMNEEIDQVQTYISEQLGDARTFSLDSPKSRKPNLDRLRFAS